MADSGLAAGGPPLPMAVSTDGITDSPFARARRLPWLGPDVLAVFDAFVVLGLLGLYLKVALLAPQWGAVARFLGKQPGEPLGGSIRWASSPSDLVLNLLIVPFVATTIVGLAFGAWRVLAACAISVVFCLVYFVELRASTEVGQYISGEMLHDFIGWSATHASSASDYLTTASLIKLCVRAGDALRRAAGGARRPPIELPPLARGAAAAARRAGGARGGGGRRRHADRLRRPAPELAPQHERGDAGGDVADDGADDRRRRFPWLSLDDALGGAAAADAHGAVRFAPTRSSARKPAPI